MSTTDKQIVIDTINTFINESSLQNAIKVVELFALIKGENGVKFLQIVRTQPMILQATISEVIKQLLIEYKINEVQNKQQQLILVF